MSITPQSPRLRKTGGVARDSEGNLYGVTPYCGGDYGEIYELGVKGKLTVLYSFQLLGSSGTNPYGEVLRTADGTLFSTTLQNGTFGAGTVWSYVP